MAVKDLDSTQISALVGTRDAITGVEYPAAGLQPWHAWLIRTLNHLGLASAGAFQVKADDANASTVRILPGRAVIGGVVLVYAGGTVDLAAFNNDTAYVWLSDSGGGVAAIGSGTDAAGWPTTPHVKLAEVTLASGLVTANLDRRFETILHAGLGHAYALAITTAGSIASPSTVTVTTSDLQGGPMAQQGILRVRVCDSGGYADATNATIAPAPAPGANTTTLETVTAGKDLILQGHTDGTFGVELTDATAETVTLRIGAPPLSGLRADFSPTINVTHA